jgi:DENN (AEX-3) domain
LHELYFRYRNTKPYGFSLENYSFELLLQSLIPEKLIYLLTALLLERKLILIKDSFGDLALILESFVTLLSPLKWNFVFITYLSPRLVECLDAPFLYVIGVSREVWREHCVMREYYSEGDVIVFDIDN